jgi:phospholipase C
MSEITRRRLLGTGAVAAGGAVASTLLPPSLREALAAGPRAGSLRDIEHVVIHMQENRSFDHYFGTLAGVRGFGDTDTLSVTINGQPKSIFYQPDPTHPDGYLLPWHLDTQHTSSQAIPSTSHAWQVQHQAWNGGKMDSWLPAHLTADGATNGPYTMSYYEREDVPFHFALAENFTLCDGYHASLLGPTWPNRLYLMSGMIDPSGKHGGPIISNVVNKPYTWTTYPERLEKAGVSWQVYQEEDDYGCNVLEFFGQYQDAKPGSALYEKALTISQPGAFERDARAGRLPKVSWIIPTSGQSEHPAYIPASGADYLASKIEAVASNRELWNKTLFIVNYDENDGLFDHVPPPTPPAGTPGEFVDGLPIGGGIRVPCILISPWTVGGFVATETFDHTSVLQLLERLTGVREPNITPWRRKTFGDLTSALGFAKHPQRHAFPSLPATRARFWAAEREVQTLPAATIPGAAQTPPVQATKRDAARAAAAGSVSPAGAATGSASRGLPGTTSRFEENRTTHRADFADGSTESEFPGRMAEFVDAKLTGAGPHAFVPLLVGGGVAVIDTQTYQWKSASVYETNPYGAAATPDGKKVYITEAGTNLVAVVDTATGAVDPADGAGIVVGVYPHGIAMAPNGRHAYVANTGPDTGPGGSDTVSVIDTGAEKVSGTFTVGQAPQMIAVSPNGKRAYVTCSQGVYAFDTGPGHGRGHRVGTGCAGAHGLAVSPDGDVVFVADAQRNQLVVIDASHHRVVKQIAVGTMPWDVAVTDDGAAAYVTNANSDTVSVIDTKTLKVQRTIHVARIPTGISARKGEMWVAGNVSSTVSVISTSSHEVTHRIELGISAVPATIAFA